MRISFHLFSTGLLVLLVSTGCSSTTGSVDSETAPGMERGEEDFTSVNVDIPKSEQLLAKAVKQAEDYAAGGCEQEIYLSDIAATVREAIKVRDTAFFRTRIIAKRAPLKTALGGLLVWQEILGTFKPADASTLEASFEAGVTFYDTNGGAYGNKTKLELRAGGEAVIHDLDVEANPANPPWKSRVERWSVAGRTLTVGSTRYAVQVDENADVFLLKDDDRAFFSYPSECDA